jgi:hypothetical protein
MIRFSSVQRSARLDNKWKSGIGVTVRNIIWTQATSDAKKIDVLSIVISFIILFHNFWFLATGTIF